MIQSICVCGAGTMGGGIAQATAQAGFHTILYELNVSILEKSKNAIEKNCSYLLKKRKLLETKRKEYFSAFYLQVIFIIVLPT